MNLRAVWQRFREHSSRWGVRRALYMRFMNRIRPRVLLWRVHIRTLGRKHDNMVQGAEDVRIATADDLAQAAADPDIDISAAFVDAALVRGDHCAAAFDGDQMVAYVWRCFSRAPFHEDNHCNLWISVRKPYRYGYKAFTDVAYRGRKLQDRVAILSDSICLDMGFTDAISLVESHNIASVRSDLGRGNRLIGYVVVAHLGGRTLIWRSPGAKRTGVELIENHRD